MADPKRKQPDLYGAGQRLRTAFGESLGQQQRALTRGLVAATGPAIAPVVGGAQVVRGFAGAQQAAPAAAQPAPQAAPQAAPLPRSSGAFANVVGGSGTQQSRTLDGGVSATVDARGNSVYRNTPGATVPKPPSIPTPGPITAAASNAPQVQATTQRTLGQVRGNTMDARADAASVLNPMSADAEIMRRFEISQGLGSNKGSPQARRMAGEAILGQLSARNTASATGQVAGNTAAQQGAITEAAANEGFAQRSLDASQSNQASEQTTAQRLAEGARPSQLVRGLDGNTNVLRNDGTTGTLRDEAGKPIATPAPATAGAITPQDLLKAQTDEIAALQQNIALTPEQRDAAMAEITSRYAALGGTQKPSKPSLQQFLAAAKQANPNASDAELTSFYSQKYGQ